MGSLVFPYQVNVPVTERDIKGKEEHYLLSATRVNELILPTEQQRVISIRMQLSGDSTRYFEVYHVSALTACCRSCSPLEIAGLFVLYDFTLLLPYRRWLQLQEKAENTASAAPGVLFKELGIVVLGRCLIVKTHEMFREGTDTFLKAHDDVQDTDTQLLKSTTKFKSARGAEKYVKQEDASIRVGCVRSCFCRCLVYIRTESYTRQSIYSIL